MKSSLFLVAFLVLIASCQTSSDKALEIVPPFEKINVQGDSITFDPSFKQVTKLGNGVNIEIPEYAFTDEEGEPVTGAVTLIIKLYNTAAQIIASGIPMIYSSYGDESNFESAGMFQISGNSNGVPVFIKEGKELTINYPSEVYGDYDFFLFEDESALDLAVRGKWKRLTKTRKQIIDSSRVIDTFKLQLRSSGFAIRKYSQFDL